MALKTRRRSPRACTRKAVALVLVTGATALAVVWPSTVSAQTPEPPTTTTTVPATDPDKGFTIPPAVLPPLVITAGAGAVGAGATAGGGTAIAACGTATAGSCLVMAAALGVSFWSTTKALEAWDPFDWYDYPEPASLPGSGISSGWVKCSTRAGAGFAEAVSRSGPGATCLAISYAALQGFQEGNARGIKLDSQGRSQVEWPAAWGLLTYDGVPINVREVNPLTRYGRWLPELIDGVAQPGTLIVHRSAQETLPCMGYVACGVFPTDIVDLDILPAYHSITGRANMGKLWLDPRVRVHGLQRRIQTTIDCYKPETGESHRVEASTGWFFDSERDQHPTILPQCQGTDFLRQHIVARLHTLGLGTVETLFDVEIPEGAFANDPALARCLRSVCTIEKKTGTEEGDPDYCEVAGFFASMIWCDAKEQIPTTKTDFPPPDPCNKLGTFFGQLDCAPPKDTPDPEPPDVDEPKPKPPGPPGASDGECFPSGWGLFNPVEWVLKPVKCALSWAFVPTIPISETLTELRTSFDSSTPGEIKTAVVEWQDVYRGGLAGEGSTGCMGPPISYSIMGTNYGPFHPFNACDEPMRNFADFFRNLTAALAVLMTLVYAYNRVVVPFGIEPMRTPEWSKVEAGLYRP